MHSYQRFIFEQYECNRAMGTIRLRYGMRDTDAENESGLQCTETLSLDPQHWTAAPNGDDLHRALRSLHIIGGISYYKTCLPRTIEIRNRTLSRDEAAFWTTVYENGLGEFFYRNAIDPDGIVRFPHGPVQAPTPADAPTAAPGRILVPIGGGKDSLLTASLLQSNGYDVVLLRMGGHPLIEQQAAALGLPLITVGRALDAQLFTLNANGALNGHVPITAYLCCVATVVALLNDCTHVVLSNERSADEGNLLDGDRTVNHQWSKSSAFEELFAQHLHQRVTRAVSVFSLLRPLSELQIVRALSRLPELAERSTSCNANWKILATRQADAPRWCGTCPKCAFAYVLFAAWNDSDMLHRMFGKDLFADASLLPLYRSLLGIEGHKPFECVGTAAETSAAFLLAEQRSHNDDTPVAQMFREEVRPHIDNPEEIIRAALTSTDHRVPEPFASLLHDL